MNGTPKTRRRDWQCRHCTSAVTTVFLLLLGSIASGAQLVGKRVSETLDDLRKQGITFIYNTDIVQDSLRVSAEPRAGTAEEIARQILAPHHLALRLVAPRIYAVVRTPAPAPAEESSSAAAPVSQRLEEVVVQTSRYAVAAPVGGSHAFLDQAQVATLPRLGDETLQSVQRLPGVAVNGFSSIGPVRGGLPNETAIMLDGLRLYEPFHLKNYLTPVSLLDSRIIDGIDVYFGGFPAVYGDRMSAVIDARTINPDIAQYYELGLTLFHASALAAFSFHDEAGHALISARRSNLGELSQLAENDVGKPQYADGFSRLTYQVNDSTRVSFNSLLSTDEIRAVRNSGTETARDESSNSYLWLTMDHDWSSALTSRAILSWTDVHNERDGQVFDPGRRVGTVEDDRTFGVVGLRIDTQWQGKVFTHRFGAELRRLWADYEYSADVRSEAGFPLPDSPATRLNRSQRLNPDGYEASGYWDVRFAPAAAWVVEGGLRVDTQTYDGSGDAEQWGPRLSVLYQATPTTRVRATWGRFYQSQGINELQVEDGITGFHPAQHAVHTIMSIEQKLAQKLDARLELYRKDYGNLSPRFENLLDPTQLLPELAFDRVRVDADRARAEGVELSFNWRPRSEWSGWFSYSWSRATDRIGSANQYRSWDQRHAVSLGLAWNRGPWSLTIADAYHSGWPTTQLELTTTPSQPVVTIGPRNAVRYRDFNSLDVRITRTFALPRGQLDTFFEITNALSRQNPCCSSYELSFGPDGTAMLRRDTDSWLPLIPSFGVLWRYGRP